LWHRHEFLLLEADSRADGRVKETAGSGTKDQHGDSNGIVMAKFVKIENTKGQYLFECPGCGDSHSVTTCNEGYPHPIWTFNGDINKPTVSPSILVRYPANPNAMEEFKEWRKERVCHSFVKGGMIQFLSDCTHKLAGQTVELPDIK